MHCTYSCDLQHTWWVWSRSGDLLLKLSRKKKDFRIFRWTRSFPRFPSNQTHFVIFLPASFSFIRRCCIIGEATCSVFIIRKGREIEGGRESCFSLISSATTGRHTHTFTHKHSETYAQPVCSSLRDGHRKHSYTRLCGHRSSEQHHRYRKACDIYSTVSTWVANSHLQVNSLRSFVFWLYPQIWARMQRACFVFED